MANTTNFSVRIDTEIKKQSEMLYKKLGMNLTTAINIFLRQSILVGGVPFDVKLKKPNVKTAAAIKESEKLAKALNVKRYNNVEEALSDLKK